MSYYNGSDYDADEYEDYEEPQRQRSAPRTPGLRAAMKAMRSEIAALKKERDELKSMNDELMEDSSQPSQGTYPRSTLTQAEQLQVQRLQEMGVLGVSAPSGTQAEQIAQMNQCRNAQELQDYLRSQGAPLAQNYSGMGY